LNPSSYLRNCTEQSQRERAALARGYDPGRAGASVSKYTGQSHFQAKDDASTRTARLGVPAASDVIHITPRSQ